MLIVFFSNLKNKEAKRLLANIQNKFHRYQIETVQTVKAFEDRFHSLVPVRTILILLPHNRRQLAELIGMRDLMDDHPILLVLPDRGPLTASIGHKLYPRFMSHLDGDLSSLVAVLARMIENAEQRKGYRMQSCLPASDLSINRVLQS